MTLVPPQVDTWPPFGPPAGIFPGPGATADPPTNQIFLNDFPGADPTGATFSDTALAAAQAAAGSAYQIVMGIGTYKFAGNYTVKRNQSLVGLGSAVTKVNWTGSGVFISQNDTAGWNPFASVAGSVSRFSVTTTAQAGRIGLEYGDLLRITNTDLVFVGFLGAGSKGYLGKNSAGWSEEGIHQVRCYNCTDAFVWDTGSFDYSFYNFYANIFTGTAGNVLTLQNNVQLAGGFLILNANCGTIAGNAGWLIALDPGDAAGTSFFRGSVSIFAETDGSVGTGHIPIVIGGGTACQLNVVGNMEGIAGSGGVKWGASTFTGLNRFSIAGRLNFNEVTPQLGAMASGDAQVTWGTLAKREVSALGSNLAGAMFLNSADTFFYQLGATVTPTVAAGFTTTTPTRKVYDLYFKCNNAGGCVVTWSSMPGGTPLFAGAGAAPALSIVVGQIDHLRLTWSPVLGKCIVEVMALGLA